MKKNLFKSAFSGIVESLVSISLLFFLTPFMLEELGFEKYGLWILIVSILGFFQVFAIGLPTAVQRSIAIHFAKKDNKGINTIFSCSIFLFLIIGFVASLLLIALGINSRFIDSSNSELLSFALIVLSIKLFLQFFMLSFYGFFSALLRFDIDNYITTSCEIIKAALIILLIKKLQINGLIIAVLISDFIGYIIKIFYAKKIYPQLKFSTQYISKKEILKLFNFSKHVVANSLTRSINVNADPILITKIFNLNSVSLFNIPSRFCASASKIVSSIVNISFPLFSYKFAKKEDMSELFNRIVCINLSICLFIYLPIFALSETFLRLWVGEEFKNAINIVFFLIFSLVCQAYGKPIQDLLLAQGNHQRFAFVNLAGSLLNVSCSIIFASFAGITGIAVGTAIGFFMTEIILYSFLVKKFNDLSLKKALFKFVHTTTILFFVGVTINRIIKNLEIANWSEFLFYAILIGFFSLTISWFVVLNHNLRFTVTNIITQQVKQKLST